MAIPAINVLGNPNVTEGNFQIAIEDLRKSVIGSGKAYDSANTYSQYDTCVSGGIVYYSKINSNTGNTPAVNANWGLVSELIKLIASPTTNALVKLDANGNIVNSNIIIDDNGNVGVESTPSAWNTSYKAITLHNYGSLYNGLGKYGMLMNGVYDTNNSFKYSVSDYASMYLQLAGMHQWSVAQSGTAGNAINWTNAMTLDASGNLELGTSTSSEQVLKIFGGGSSNITFKAIQSAGAFSVYSHTDSSNILRSGILSNGTYQSANNVYGSTSDIKLKENVRDASLKLDKLMQVQVRTFNYIGQEEKQIGVVAQEIEKIFPSIVYETKDTKQVEVEKEREKTLEDGTVEVEKYTEIETVETGETTKNVKYSIMYMMMLKGMQEMRAEYTTEIEALKNELTVLKGAK